MQLEFITTPLIGGLIGIVTNGLAIKMIFKPLKPIYIGKFRVPFTPGLVPKEQKRIAKAIGRVAGEKILDSDTLKKALLSENVKGKMLDKFDKTIQKFSDIEDTLEVFLEQKGIIDTVNDSEEKIKKSVSEHIKESLIKADIGKVIVEYAENEIIEKLNPMIYSIAAGAITNAKEPMARKVNAIINDKAPTVISEYIDKEYSNIMKTPVKELADKISEKFPDLKQNLWKWYEKFIDEKAEGMIRGFDIQNVVEQKICEFDVEELERIIMKITKKELNALVYLGGVLGVLMGFINVLIL